MALSLFLFVLKWGIWYGVALECLSHSLLLSFLLFLFSAISTGVVPM